MYRGKGQGEDAGTLPTVVAAQCPSVLPGTGTIFIFPHRHSVIAKLLLSNSSHREKKKKNEKKGEYLNLPEWTRRNSLWFNWLDFSYVLAEGPAGGVLGDASMALRPFGVSWVSLKVLLDPPGNTPWFYTSADGCCWCLTRFAHHQ